jgi:hypothetical protein
VFPHPSPAAPKGRSPRVNNKHRASFIGEISPKKQIKKENNLKNSLNLKVFNCQNHGKNRQIFILGF